MAKTTPYHSCYENLVARLVWRDGQGKSPAYATTVTVCGTCGKEMPHYVVSARPLRLPDDPDPEETP